MCMTDLMSFCIRIRIIAVFTQDTLLFLNESLYDDKSTRQLTINNIITR